MEDSERFYYGLGAALQMEGITYFANNHGAIHAGLEAAVQVAQKEHLKTGSCINAVGFCHLLTYLRAAYCPSPYFERFIFYGGKPCGEMVMAQHIKDEKLPEEAIEAYRHAAQAFLNGFNEEIKQQERQQSSGL
jgi:hypothetical protein